MRDDAPGYAATRRDERGQVIPLFVIMFTVLLAISAYAIDQGFWYGRATVHQRNADVIARSAAFAMLGAQNPVTQANNIAGDNQIDPVGVELVSCPGGASGVRVTVERDAPSLFSRFFDIANISIAADSTACAGTSNMVELQESDFWQSGDDLERGLPFVLVRGVGDCFTGNNLRIGQECTIWNRLAFDAPGPGNFERLLWRTGGGGQCLGSQPPVRWRTDNAQELFRCRALPSNANGCPGNSAQDALECVRTRFVPATDDNWQEDIFEEIDDRLDQDVDCAGADSYSFRQAFSTVDGADPAPPPISNASASTVYVQDNCFNNPRVAILPIINSTGSDGTGRPVVGFAAVYLTGCYFESGDPTTASSAESRTCNNSNAPDDPTPNCNSNRRDEREVIECYELRGIPIRIYLPDEGSVSPSSMQQNPFGAMSDTSRPLTILTVE